MSAPSETELSKQKRWAKWLNTKWVDWGGKKHDADLPWKEYMPRRQTVQKARQRPRRMPKRLHGWLRSSLFCRSWASRQLHPSGVARRWERNLVHNLLSPTQMQGIFTSAKFSTDIEVMRPAFHSASKVSMSQPIIWINFQRSCIKPPLVVDSTDPPLHTDYRRFLRGHEILETRKFLWTKRLTFVKRLKRVALFIGNTAFLLPIFQLLSNRANHSVDVIHLEHFTPANFLLQLTSSTYTQTVWLKNTKYTAVKDCKMYNRIHTLQKKQTTMTIESTVQMVCLMLL